MTKDSNQSFHPEPSDPMVSSEAEPVVTLSLPVHLARLIQARSQQLGKSPTEVILALLQSALGPQSPGLQSLGPQSPEQPEPASAPLPATPLDMKNLEAIQTRLAALEAMIPRLVQLEGK